MLKFITILIMFFVGAFVLEFVTAPPEEQQSRRAAIEHRLANLPREIMNSYLVAPLMDQGVSLVDLAFDTSGKQLSDLMTTLMERNAELMGRNMTLQAQGASGNALQEPQYQLGQMVRGFSHGIPNWLHDHDGNIKQFNRKLLTMLTGEEDENKAHAKLHQQVIDLSQQGFHFLEWSNKFPEFMRELIK